MAEIRLDMGGDWSGPSAGEEACLLVAELQHRIKNLHAVVHALAYHSLKGDLPLAEAREIFIGRLEALARADQRLISAAWKGTRLGDLVRSELKPYAGRVKIEGPNVTLDARGAQGFALALHELATNASKYGALDGSDGTISIGWVVTAVANGGLLKFSWREHGGPPVTAPKKTGFGTSLVRATLGGGRFEYSAEGLTYEANIPYAMVTQNQGAPAKEGMAE
jgi:two-component sensor histidine kinase